MCPLLRIVGSSERIDIKCLVRAQLLFVFSLLQPKRDIPIRKCLGKFQKPQKHAVSGL